MQFVARIDDLSSAEVQDLVAEHLRGMHAHTPPGHVNALAIEALRRPDITFWSVWSGESLCGCGALKELDASTGEIKSMRTRPAFLRQGLGQFLLDEIVRTARSRGYQRLCLETGTGPAFDAAHALYLRNGFRWCGAFGDYQATEFNVFMEKRLPPRNRVISLQPRLPVVDIAATVRFFRDVLGFECVGEPTNADGFALVHRDGLGIQLVPAGADRPPPVTV